MVKSLATTESGRGHTQSWWPYLEVSLVGRKTPVISAILTICCMVESGEDKRGNIYISDRQQELYVLLTCRWCSWSRGLSKSNVSRHLYLLTCSTVVPLICSGK